MSVPDDPEKRSWLRRLLGGLEADRAVIYAVSARAWQFLAGPVTMVLIARYFSKDVQGYYYTFASLLALQTFVELGLHNVIINLASHEWAKLELDPFGTIRGDGDALSRLVGLGRFIFKWYAAAFALFVVGVGTAGVLFFGAQEEAGVGWQSPWWSLVILSGALLWTLPFNALLEGCNQVAQVNRFRIQQAVTATLVIWVSIASGLELWATVTAALSKLLWDLYLLCVRYKEFFRPFARPAEGPVLAWRSEIWPLQWRLAVMGAFNYFGFYLLTPVMFHYHGAADAGQMGMTWAALTAIQAACFAWVQTRAARFGILIAGGKFADLNLLFGRLMRRAILVQIVTSWCFFATVWGLYLWLPRYGERLLPPLPTAALAVALILMNVPQCQSVYVRAHKQEPFLLQGVISSTLTAVLVWLWGGSWLGPLGAALALLAVNGLFTIPYSTYLWNRCRVENPSTQQQ